MRHHWPISRTVLAACAPLALVGWIHWDAVVAISFSVTTAAWFVGGLLYTQFAEYWCHRVPMHRGLPYLRHVRLNHLEHHAIFHGASFKTRNPQDLEHIAGRYWVFPVLFIAHYAVLVLVFAPQAVVVFLTAAVVHYLAFEITHWLTHIDDNSVDRFLDHIPILGELRAYQIEHHRVHHEIPEVAFNFNPPYLGDRVSGRLPSLDELPTLLEPAPAPVEPAVEGPLRWRARWLRYGSAAVVGCAIVGAMVVAHGVLTHSKRAQPAPEQLV